MDVTAAKRRAGEAAAERVADGDVVGLGTGSTAAHAIRALGRRVDAGLDVRGVPTSYGARAVARKAGVPLTDLADPVDVAIDGADAVADGGRALIKGGGAAHAREKVVVTDADRFVVVVDRRKIVDRLDDPVPVAALPDALPAVERSLRDAGGTPERRASAGKDGPVVTDDGAVVLDVDFGRIDDPAELATTLDAVPGIVEHGLFVDVADRLVIGDDDVTERAVS